MSPALFIISLFGMIFNAVGGTLLYRTGNKCEGMWMLGATVAMVVLFIWELG